LKGRELLANFEFQGWIILKCDFLNSLGGIMQGGLNELITGPHDEGTHVMNCGEYLDYLSNW
jgi:hypothetical protein